MSAGRRSWPTETRLFWPRLNSQPRTSWRCFAVTSCGISPSLCGRTSRFKALNALTPEQTPEQIQIIEKIVRAADGTMTYRIEGLHKWVEMAAKHCSLLTEQVQMVDHRHVEDKLIEARDRAVKLGQAKTKETCSAVGHGIHQRS